MSQPRKKSSFAQASPIAPPNHSEQSQVPVRGEEPSVASSTVTEAPQAKEPASLESKKKKVGFYQLPAEEKRTRAAWMHTMGHTGHTTITSYLEAAVAAYTRKLEEEYNDSKPF